jgi:SOS-response transcriptional repressor LexA
MNGIAKRIRQLRKIEKKSLRVFARELDISPSALGNYERGRIPSMEFIYNLSLRKNVSADWLLTGVGRPNNYPKVDLKIIASGEIKQHFNHIESRENYVILRLLSDSAAAEPPSSINENDIEGYAVTYRSWCKNPEMTTCVRVHGSSMSPLLPDGSIVAINHQERNPEKLKGKIVAALIDDGVTVKYFDYTETHFIFYPENKQFTPIFLEKGQENVIIGKIDWFWGRL